MKVLIIVGSIITPLIMFYLQYRWERFRVVFHIGAIIATLVFGNIASVSIYQIIKDNTVMMTNIHAIFLRSVLLNYRLLYRGLSSISANKGNSRR